MQRNKLSNFGDIAVLPESCPELSAKADSLAEAIADFYQRSADADHFNKELDDGGENDEEE